MSETTTTKEVSLDDPDFLALVAELNEFLDELNGEKKAFFDQFNLTSSLDRGVVCYVEGLPVACGGLRYTDDQSAEVKRMYVRPDRRRSGCARRVLQALEGMARESGRSVARLETSRRLVQAVGLYSSSGYTVIDNYGPYVGVEESVCMEKRLA